MDIRIIGIVGKLKPDILKAPSDYARKAVLCVARRHLTPPPSSTNVERLFSVGGLTAADHRASLSGEKLDQILFLRENALMANFNLGWQQGVTTAVFSLSATKVHCLLIFWLPHLYILLQPKDLRTED